MEIKGMIWWCADDIYIDIKDENGNWKCIPLNKIIMENFKENSVISISLEEKIKEEIN